MLQTIIIYLCWSLVIRGIYFGNYALLSIWVCTGIFYIISEYFETVYLLLSNYRPKNKHIIAVFCTVVLLLAGLSGYLKDPLQASYISITIFLLFSSLFLFYNKSIKELVYYPITWLFFWLSIIWLIRNISELFLDRYEMVTIEKARIREIIESTPNDRHPPLQWPWIISDLNNF